MGRFQFPRTVLALTLALVAGNSLFAGDENDKHNDRVADGQVAGMPSPQENDRRIVRALKLGNQGEVELAKLAQKKATSESVKNFANMMVEDHQKCLDELKLIHDQSKSNKDVRDEPSGAKIEVKDGNETRVLDANRTAVVIKDDGKSRDGKMMIRAIDFLAVKEQVCKETLNACKDEMNKLEGSEFDKAFMGKMVGSHTEMLATCKALKGYASQNLAELINRGEEKTKEHLEKAKQICSEMKGHTATTTTTERTSAPVKTDKDN